MSARSITDDPSTRLPVSQAKVPGGRWSDPSVATLPALPRPHPCATPHVHVKTRAHQACKKLQHACRSHSGQYREAEAHR